MKNFGPHPTQYVSIEFRNIADRMLRSHPRLKISVRWAPAICQPPGFKRGRGLAKYFAASPPPPNFVDTASIDAVRAAPRKKGLAVWSDKDHSMQRDSHAYTEVLGEPPDGRLLKGLRMMAKAKPDKKPSRQAESTVFPFHHGARVHRQICPTFPRRTKYTHRMRMWCRPSNGQPRSVRMPPT